jgi:hypothetical protein
MAEPGVKRKGRSECPALPLGDSAHLVLTILLRIADMVILERFHVQGTCFHCGYGRKE